MRVNSSYGMIHEKIFNLTLITICVSFVRSIQGKTYTTYKTYAQGRVNLDSDLSYETVVPNRGAVVPFVVLKSSRGAANF